MDTKISPISYKFKTKTAKSSYPKYFFIPNHWAHDSIWCEFQGHSNRWASDLSITLWQSEIENVDLKISPISYKFKTKNEISAFQKYFFTSNHWAHGSISYEFHNNRIYEILITTYHVDTRNNRCGHENFSNFLQIPNQNSNFCNPEIFFHSKSLSTWIYLIWIPRTIE